MYGVTVLTSILSLFFSLRIVCVVCSRVCLVFGVGVGVGCGAGHPSTPPRPLPEGGGRAAEEAHREERGSPLLQPQGKPRLYYNLRVSLASITTSG